MNQTVSRFQNAVRHVTRLSAGLTLVPAILAAQSKGSGSIAGVVKSSAGTPIADAMVSVALGTDTIITRTDDDGSYLFTKLIDGNYVLEARRLGFAPMSGSGILEGKRAHRDVELREIASSLDVVNVNASWTGITGIVGDFFKMQPLSGVTVHVVGSRDSTVTDEHGRFRIPIKDDGSVVLRVQEDGYAPQMISASIDKGRNIDLAVLLESSKGNARDASLYSDLDRRQRMASPRAALVSRAELLATGTEDLMTAIRLSETGARNSLQVTRGACVFIDGVPKPGIPVDVVRTRNVEFVEVFPSGTDASNSLATRWPYLGGCGISDGRSRNAFNGAANTGQLYNSGVAKYVLVWTKK